MEKPKAKSFKSPVVRAAPEHWHAVTLLPKGEPCAAMRVLRGVRFLSSDAPRLPLPDCTRAQTCGCAYRHHADRRGTPRRADEGLGLKRNKKINEERRQEKDRRKSD
jgi:hypothetical protein